MTPRERLEFEEVDRAMEDLPGKYRAVLHYKYELGFNAAEIAEQLGMSHENVRVCLHRAIRSLRERMSR